MRGSVEMRVDGANARIDDELQRGNVDARSNNAEGSAVPASRIPWMRRRQNSRESEKRLAQDGPPSSGRSYLKADRISPEYSRLADR